MQRDLNEGHYCYHCERHLPDHAFSAGALLVKAKVCLACSSHGASTRATDHGSRSRPATRRNSAAELAARRRQQDLDAEYDAFMRRMEEEEHAEAKSPPP